MVYLKDDMHSEMPRTCAECLHRDFNWCTVMGKGILGRTIYITNQEDVNDAVKEIESLVDRPKWCPLVELDEDSARNATTVNVLQKLWNAMYAEEDKWEKKFCGTQEHDNWFTNYRPWLQNGFEIAIKVLTELGVKE